MQNESARQLAVLSDDVINKIAAGEVIERPASIVRELVDNAIDAAATSVVVEVRDGGQSLVKVSDDGCGLSAEDAQLCFKRHATSKIKNIADLEQISSLGFRGEALSSIAAVSEIKLRSKCRESEIGNELILHEGRLISNRACGAADGTEFEVTKLFLNLPARRKFLKSPRTDLARIQEWLYHSALANPKVRYRLLADGKEIFRLGSHTDIFTRLDSLLTGSTIKINYSAGPFLVRGVIAHPSQAEYKVGGFVFLVNGRPIQDRMLMRSLRDAWSTGMRSAENPIGALEIFLPASEVDINVHPQKSEVRFRNSQAVFASLYKAVKAGLSEWKPEFLSEKKSFPNPNGYLSNAVTPYFIAATNETVGLTNDYSSSACSSLQLELNQQRTEEESMQSAYSSERYIGQILGVFLLFERRGQTFLVDAHAAHERIRFNELLAWAAKKETFSQRLLIPEEVQLLPKEVASILERKEELTAFGLHIQDKENKVLVTEMPSILRSSDLGPFLKGVAELEVADLDSSIQKIIEKIMARTACRSSVMSGMRLSDSEARVLWEQIRIEPQGAVCPHGRPVMVELSRAEIDKMFLRDGF